METMGKKALTLKIADGSDEFEQIHRLNYETFVEEIHQHEENTDGYLIDKFHDKNTYVIAKEETNIVGMVCVCTARPFSLDQKIRNLDEYLPGGEKVAEIRLLCISKGFRKKTVFIKLMLSLYEYLEQSKIAIVVASGLIKELPLYYHMGFVPFGNIVGTEKASFQPILLKLERVRLYAHRLKESQTDKEN